MNRILMISKPEQLISAVAELDSFFALYLKNFPDADEREDPKVICDRIKHQHQDSNEPETTLLISLTNEAVSGGAILEYYQHCECFLLTYIVVNEEYRGQHIAKYLVDTGIRQVVSSKGERVKALFFESNIPWETDVQKDSFDGWARYRIFSRLGAKWVNIDYAQPALGSGKKSVDHLHLFLFPQLTRLRDRIPKELVRHFLKEFYRSLAIRNPDKNQDFIRAISSMDGAGESLPLMEIPAPEGQLLRFRDVSVAFHLAEVPEGAVTPVALHEKSLCPVIGSFETDLLKLRHQETPPFLTRCVGLQDSWRCKINFPDMTTFLSEGRHVSLKNLSASLILELKINCTEFRFGRKIWTLVFTPREGDTLGEDQIIKLIALFNRSTEGSNIVSRTTFEIGDHCFDKIEQVATYVTNSQQLRLIRSGLLQVDFATCEGALPEANVWKELIGLIGKATKKGGKSLADMEKRYHEDKAFCFAINLLCGFSLGIFDYRRMTFEEATDTLLPMTISRTALEFMNRGLITAISYGDDNFLSNKDTIGISPYLLISSVLLASNEIEAYEAKQLLDQALNAEHIKLEELIVRRRKIDHILHEEILFNVFHYPGEQKIFAEGMKQRGIDDLMVSLENRLGRLVQLIRDKDTRRKVRFEKSGVIMLAVISIMSLENIIGDFTLFCKNTLKISWMQGEEPKWIIFITIALIVFLLILYFTFMSIVDTTQKLEKKRGTNRLGAIAGTFWSSFVKRFRSLCFWRE